MVDVSRLVRVNARTPDASSSQVIRKVNAKVAMPAYDDDSQITDSFLEHLEENIHVIYHTAVATSCITDINELHQKVLSLVFEFTKADRGCILLVDEKTREISPAAFRQRDEIGESMPIDVSEEALRHVEEKEEGVIHTETINDPRKRRGCENLRPGTTIQSMCVPMQGRMGTVGFIYVENVIPPAPPVRRTRPAVPIVQRQDERADTFQKTFTVAQLKMLLAIGHQAALATENATWYAAMNRNAQLAAVGETFTQIAHHIRNMLQGIDQSKKRMAAGLDRKNWDLLLEGWGEIEPLTSRIYELSLNLLSFSKPRAPRLQLDSINDCIGDVVGTVESRAAARGIRLDWGPNLALKPFYFDAEAMYRAVLNVVQNALDACTLGCVVKIRVTESDGKIEISVIDDGQGIDPRKIGLIFQPFATTKGELGTGIGLPVTRKILREHGGEVSVSSTLGHGSNFKLTLPARRARTLEELDDGGAPETAHGGAQRPWDTNLG
jgi:signal transduction histidine kinase